MSKPEFDKSVLDHIETIQKKDRKHAIRAVDQTVYLIAQRLLAKRRENITQYNGGHELSFKYVNFKDIQKIFEDFGYNIEQDELPF